MYYYKCENCKSEWNGIKILKSCPFCDTGVAVKSSNFTKIDEVLSYIFGVYGIDVIKDNNRLVALLSDYAPTLERERKLIKVAMSLGIYSDLVTASKNDNPTQELAINKAISKLHNDAFMDPVIAKEIIGWFVSCLGWSNNKKVEEELKDEKISSNNDTVEIEISQVNVGETIIFGTYLQDNLGKPTGIEWDVISINGNQALLLSKKCLDVYPYAKVKIGKTWQFSDLRKWLNNEFINSAFSAKDQLAIMNNVITMSRNPRSNVDSGAVVSDKIFILSREEIIRYNLEKKTICQATKYAISRGVYCGSETIDAYWWLRTPGYTNESAMYITGGGRLDELGCAVNAANKGVRPAIWVDLRKLEN